MQLKSVPNLCTGGFQAWELALANSHVADS